MSRLRRRDDQVVRVSKFLHSLEDLEIVRGDPAWTAEWVPRIRSALLGADKRALLELRHRAQRVSRGQFDFLHPLVGLAYYLVLLEGERRVTTRAELARIHGGLGRWLDSELAGLDRALRPERVLPDPVAAAAAGRL